jgi:hypothetical protein
MDKNLAHRPRGRCIPKPSRRRALELLANAGHEGCTEAVMLANGVTIEQMVEAASWVRARFASTTPRRVRAGRERMEIATVWITDAGRKALIGTNR